MSLQLNAFIMMDGNAQEAILFYEKSLGAKVLFKQTVGEGPKNSEISLTADEKARVSHSVLKIGESEIMVSDNLPGQPFQSGNQVTICITADVKEEAKQIYEALKQEGQVNMPLQETYFSPAYGIVIDKFGVTFQIFTKNERLNQL
jgi:PhnB protein